MEHDFGRSGFFSRAEFAYAEASDIYANKIEAILLRKKARDFVDLYTIAKRKKWSFRYGLGLHKKKKVNELEDFPKMKIKLDRQEMIKFFENEARKLGEKILL